MSAIVHFSVVPDCTTANSSAPVSGDAFGSPVIGRIGTVSPFFSYNDIPMSLVLASRLLVSVPLRFLGLRSLGRVLHGRELDNREVQVCVVLPQ